ncbi:hypothetical protein [Bdellovibrio bacteriovorus]|uniref:Uncharacterized protein n=1 Tax=Bdellovibrio bacteriovorus TaxID=959 RepID=A0A1Z3NC52_BDEBC|nr:hypothetical protein [Bdellovibrio bacteriovorus]ASD65027.1 hypothetical protein B9G79_16355 [Bdellovibrio bacteriovorus]
MKFGAKKIALGISTLAVVGAGAWYFVFSNRKPSGTSVGLTNWEQLKKTHNGAVRTHMDSPAGKAWTGKNFENLKQSFGVEKSKRDNERFFRASIYILDAAKIEWLESDQVGLNDLKLHIARFICQDRAQLVGDDAKAVRYAVSVLTKLGVDEESRKVLEKTYLSTKDANQKDSISELLIAMDPMPALAKKELDKDIAPKGNILEGLRLLTKVKDEHFKRNSLTKIYQNYGSYPEKVRPRVFKHLVIHRKDVDGDLKKYLAKKVDLESEEKTDAFLTGLRALGVADQYKSELSKIVEGSPHPHMRTFAEVLLSEVQMKDKGMQ